MMHAIVIAVLLGLTTGKAAASGLEVGLLELVNYYEYSSQLLSSGQPTRDQFPAIRDAGVEVVINLAPVTDPASLPDEQDIVTALGLDYTHIPVDWDHPSTADVERYFAAMKRHRGQRILVHCYAGSRASAFVYLYRIRELRASPDDARATLVGIWGNNPGYELAKVPQWLALIEQGEKHKAD